ncbi:DUF2207 family protein [Schnuerera sp. xch1]|uniref:DUF2207 family protein n=1 Tax=Schnuerera sp. xch1 TaxID=2874283 RepID=UPI001CBD9650|nr:DUF2207 domain-containing protein [Schnuerera sp. xch1]
MNAEEDLSISRWIINSEVMENGDLKIVEDISFNFNNDFNGVFRDVVLNDTNGIDGIQVSELVQGNEVNYTRVDDAKKGAKNVYMLIDDEKNVNIQIFSPSEDEQKTFRIRYTVKNVSVKYNDTGELYYKFLGEENDTPIDFFGVNIKLPQNITDNVKIFAHGPSNGTINFGQNNTVRAEASDISKDTFVEVRILFPANFIPGSTNVVNRDAYDEIIDEELSYARKIEQREIKREERKDLFNNISIILSGLLAVIIGFIFNKFRRNKNIYETIDTNLYQEYSSPAIAALLLNGTISSTSLIATIFNLARKGFIHIDDKGEYKKRTNNFKLTRLDKSTASLLKHEKYLLEWLFDEIGDGKFIETKDIEFYSKHNSTDFHKEYNRWTKIINEEAKEKGYYDNSSKPFGIFLLIISIITFVISIVSIVFEAFYGALLIFISLFAFIYSMILLTRKSDYGYIETIKWKDFKKDLKQRSKSLNIDDLSFSLDEALIYGLALGVGFDSLKKFQPLTAQSYMPNYWMYWFFFTNSNGKNTFENSINKSFTNTGASTGSGGGFSAGGGGGAGGGGAGGF